MSALFEEDLRVEICSELRNELLLLRNEEQQLIIHCSIYSMDFDDAARIWKKYLFN